jgi:glycosyltransferase involved in cell wall biosynthesis
MSDLHRSEVTVSVIIVVRNGERALPGALDSIQAQTRPPDQVLVVDGQSIDRTAEIARSRDVEHILQPDLGLASARNLGLASTRGEVVAFLDHDDRWHHSKLERQLDLMVANPTLRYTTTKLRRRRAADAHGAFDRLDGDIVDGATPSTLMAHRSVFADVGPFDTGLRIGCDADWFARARDLGVETAMIDEALVDKHLHRDNLSTDAATNQHEMLEVVRRSLARKRER